MSLTKGVVYLIPKPPTIRCSLPLRQTVLFSMAILIREQPLKFRSLMLKCQSKVVEISRIVTVEISV